jgi:hypothetical protein
MFGIIVAVIAFAAMGWYFRAMLEPFRRHSEEHLSSGYCDYCGHCGGCRATRQSICTILHQIEISSSSETADLPDTNSNQQPEQ